jgi:hypothetical protein
MYDYLTKLDHLAAAAFATLLGVGTYFMPVLAVAGLSDTNRTDIFTVAPR